MTKKLIVTAKPTGAVSIEAEGFHGVGCTQASAFLEQALGTVTSRTEKPELHQISPEMEQHLTVQA